MLTYDQLSRLIRDYGDSFYLVDTDKFQKNYARFEFEFRSIYARTHLAWSYKTNYLPRFCRLVDLWGGMAEVVSRLELDLAQRLDVPGERVIFNGPIKTAADLLVAAQRGAAINLDGRRQLDDLLASARTHRGTVFRCGLRVTFPVAGLDRSRFGFHGDDDIRGALAALRKYGNVDILGLHCHFLTPRRQAEDYRAIAAKMVDLAERHFPDEPAKTLNLGGGFCSPMPPALAEQFSHPIPTYAEYATAIGEVFAERLGKDGPALILEPGLCLVADTVRFVCRVADIRRAGDAAAAVVTASVYDVKPTLHRRNLALEVLPNPAGRSRVAGPVDVVGNSCMEHDVLCRAFAGDVGIEDLVVVHNVGAYTNVLRPPFIHPCPPMIELAPGGSAAVLRRRDELDDVFTAYDLD